MKQTSYLFLAVTLLCVIGTTSGGQSADNPAQKPNILFIAVDDMNDWNGVLKGNTQAKTPHLKALAAKGITFTNAHCAGTSLWAFALCHHEWDSSVDLGQLHQ